MFLNRHDGPTTAMIKKFNKYSEFLKNDLAQLAVLLDPRLYNNYYIAMNNTQPLLNLNPLWQAQKSKNTKIQKRTFVNK